jgi:hypothetical protein
MSAIMSLEEARAVLKAGPKPGLENYIRHSTAVVIYGAHQMQARDPKRTLIHDLGRPVLANDAATNNREGGAEARSDYRVSFGYRRERNEMGADPDPTGSGGTLVAELDGPASAYVIVAHANGKAGLYKLGNPTGAMNPGGTATGKKFTADAQARVAAEQQRNREWADNISNFWKKQAGGNA